MAVLLYQIGIFIAIQIAAMFGRNSRNTAIVLISIFTILQVFMSWLLLLQFITIYISYNVSNNSLSNKNENQGNHAQKKTIQFNKLNMSNYGISENNPILMNSIPSSYSFLNKLKSLKNGIDYNRKGSIEVNGFANPIDVYEFTITGNHLCKLYVYAYHSRNVEEIPFPFIHLTS